MPQSLSEVTRIRGPVDLPEALQGRTLGETLHRTASYLLNTPQGLPAVWADALQRRLAPVLEVLRTSREELAVAEDQLQTGADRYWQEVERNDRLAEMGRALYESLTELVNEPYLEIPPGALTRAKHLLRQTAATFDHEPEVSRGDD